MVTIKDISRLSGFSVTTVSKALNDYPDIATKTKKRIKEICNEVGYIPNATAQSLVSKKSYTIGIIFEEMSGVGLQHPLFSKILESFKREVENDGYDILFLSNQSGNRSTGSYYQHSIRKQVEGILVLCAEFNSEEMEELYKSKIPMAIIDFHNEKILNVTSSNEEGVKLAVDYLISLGHTKIANIHGSLQTYIGEQRERYFVEQMKAHGLAVSQDYLVSGELFTKEEGYIAMKQILQLEDQPTAIICASDMLAIGAIKAIQEVGLNVPEDYSIIGFDGINAGQLISPTLTTIRQDTEQMGVTAAKNVLKMIKSKKRMRCGNTITVKTSLLEGETTKEL
ncbi:MAG: LacI family DNA-binding transcriptional regulator [Bacilli bacterium]|nr:LacI family DNA-binding transcriptional regulator [Bacilli bacterium]MBN2877856.1 LacI family DNA-binding transcriptional regulator [Bacilli bacterium]